VPGPACYGQGGENPTVTDANLIAGRLNPRYFLAGARQLYEDKALAALREKVMLPCGLTEGEAAMGIMAIAEAHMVNAIKLISVQRGLDPRDFALVGFGGAGPLHTLRLAEELGITTALIPPAPGNLSALGMLAAEVRHDLVRTRLSLIEAIDPKALEADFQELLTQGARALSAEDVAEGEAKFLMTVDLRYRGQNYELNLPLPAGDMAAALAALPARFHERHRAIFGYDNPGKPVQLVNLRLAATGAAPHLPWPTIASAKSTSPQPVERRAVQIDATTRTEIPVYRLSDLKADQEISEPTIVEYPGSTLFMPPGWSARCDQFHILHVTRAKDAA
jgi:N-methylhydantoinase A